MSEAAIEILMEQRDALLFGKWTHMGSPQNAGEACAVRYVRTDPYITLGLCLAEDTRDLTDQVARELFGRPLIDMNYHPTTSRDDILSVYDETIRRIKSGEFR